MATNDQRIHKPYLGAKRSPGTLLQILAQIPRHDTYIETHLGTGAVLAAKPPVGAQIGIEIDPETLADFNHTEAHDLFCMDCVEFLEQFNFEKAGRVVIYADPPYVWSTRRSLSGYRHDYTDADHRRLIACLKSVPASVILSGYPNKLYDDLIGDWRTHEFQAVDRGGNVRTEKLWMNFEPGDPFWHTQAGHNAEDRRRIKRLAARWGNKFESRTPGEQMAILNELGCRMAGRDHDAG